MAVLRLRDVAWADVAGLFEARGLRVQRVPDGEAIPGSYWGDSEAGLVGSTLYLRDDTPVHSALHEGCHWLCMDEARRATLHTDAGGEYAEEDAVCYLQLLLAAQVPGLGFERACQDMDAWGYTFRLGSAERWFREDADEAKTWLERAGVGAAGSTRTAAPPP